MSHIRTGTGALAAGVGTIVLLLVLSSMWIFGWGSVQQQTADYRGETSKRNQVEANGQYRIAAYDDFYNLCAAVQATEDSIAVQLEEAETASTERKQQIAANVTASRAVRASKIREYNANAHKSYTAGQFRSSDLPFQLDPTLKETSCAS